MWLVAIFAQISVYSADIRVWEMWWISEIKRQQQNKKRGLAILINEMILLKSRIMKSKPGKKVSFALAFFPLLVWICCDGLIILFPSFLNLNHRLNEVVYSLFYWLEPHQTQHMLAFNLNSFFFFLCYFSFDINFSCEIKIGLSLHFCVCVSLLLFATCRSNSMVIGDYTKQYRAHRRHNTEIRSKAKPV